jgi:hypothetical protein
MTEQDQLISKLQEILTYLQQERDSLQEGSKAYERKGKAIEGFAAILPKLTGEASASTREISRLQDQLTRFFTAIETGEAKIKRMSVGGMETRIPQYRRTIANYQPRDNGDATRAFAAGIQSALGRGEDLQEAGTTVTIKSKEQAKKEREEARQNARNGREITAENRKFADEGKQIVDEIAATEATQLRIANKAMARQERLQLILQEEKARIAEEEKLAARRKAIADSERTTDAFFNGLRRSNGVGVGEPGSTGKISDQLHRTQPTLLPGQEPPSIDRLRSEFSETLTGFDAERMRQVIAEERTVENESNRVLRDYIAERQKIVNQLEAVNKEKARVEGFRNLGNTLPGGQVASDALYAKAKKIDPRFTPETVKDVRTESSTQISRVKFQYQTAEGVIKSTTFTVDKFGKVLQDTQKRFNTFGSAIMRDTMEVMKWSVAVALVYGPMQKFGELMQDMVQIETALADVTIVLGNVQADTTELFQAAYEISQKTGESVKGVVEAYKDAYQATGGAADQTQRFATASTLLTDAITLSKLTTLDQAQAIDTLSAALRQVGGSEGLDGGTKLLNKWVATSRVANVGLEDLAAGFAVVADSANAAGIDVDKLNAIIASIAENTAGSAQEVANATKAIISSFQSDQTITQLNRLGIAYQDSSGKALNFLQIAQKVQDARRGGSISPEDFSALTLAQGGGPRRQPIVSAFYSSLDKLSAIEDASAAADETTGEAAQAVGRQLETVATSVTKLGNAFSSLAMALGGSGGLLDGFRGIVDIGTSLVDTFAKLTETLGKAGPALLATMAALAIINSKGPGFKAASYNNIGSSVMDLVGGANMAFGNKTNPNLLQQSAMMGRKAGAFAQKALPYVGAAVAVGMPAIENFSKGANAQGIGNLVGGFIGAGLGTAVAGPMGTVIGSTVGSAIAEGLVNAAQNYKPQFKGMFNDIYEPKPKDKDDLPETAVEKVRRLAEEKRVSAVDNLRETVGANFLGGVLQPLKTQVLNTAGKMFGGKGFKGVDDMQALMVELGGKHDAGLISDADFKKAIQMLTDAQAPDAKKEALSGAAKAKYAEMMNTTTEKYLDIIRDRLISGDMTNAAYTRSKDALSGFTSRGTNYMQAFGSQFKTPESAANTFGNITAFGSEDVLSQLNAYASEIADIDAAQSTLNTTDKLYVELQVEKAKKIQESMALIRQLSQEIASQAQLLESIDLSGLKQVKPDGTKMDVDVQSAAELARKKYRGRLQAQVDEKVITPEEMEAKIQALEDVMIEQDGTFTKVRQLPVDEFNQVINDLKEQKKIIDDKIKDIDFQTLDMTQSEYNSATNPQLYKSTLDKLTPLGYKENPEDVINITKDGISVEHRDQKILQYLLSKIEENTRELNGAYNLPDGASFWVPYDAAKMSTDAVGNKTTTGLGNVADDTAKKVAEEVKRVSNYSDKDYSRTMNRYGYNEDGTPTKADRTYASTRDFREADQRASATPFQPSIIPPDFKPEVVAPTENILQQMLKQMQTTLYQSPRYPLAEPPTLQGPFQPANPLPPFDFTPLIQSLSNLSTKLNLTIDNTTTVQLDGRVIASVVKQYLKNDLVRYSGTNSAQTLSVI